MQLDVRLWDLQGAVAGGAAAELATWSLLPAVCPTRWKQLSVLGHCRSETQGVFVLLGYSWCFRSKIVCPPIHTPDSYPRFIPDSYPDSYPSAAICSQEPLALWAVLAKLCRPNPQKIQNSKRSTAGTNSRLFFAEVRQKVASEGLLRCIKRDTVASAQLLFEDVTLSCPYAGS